MGSIIAFLFLSLEALSFTIQTLSDQNTKSISICDTSSHLTFDLASLKIEPQPVPVGQTVHIWAKGSLKEAVKRGSVVAVKVKYGVIQFINKEFDFCEEVASEVGHECPVEKGNITI